MEPRPISNSETGSWLQCTQKYWFEFVLKIEPKTLSDPLSIGNLGHEALQRYGEARLEGATHDKAQEVAEAEVLVPAINNARDRVDNVLKVQDIVRRYHSYRQGWPEWEILGVEQRHDLKITDEFSLPMRYDMLVRDRKTNKKALVDYKFTWDFWTPEAHEINIQFPKYVSILNAAGMDVQGAYLEELRYRPMKDMSFDKHFKRTAYFPSLASRRNALKQHVKASKQIVRFHELSEAEQEEQIIPILSKHICKFCSFQNLCTTKLNGGDISYSIETQFVDKTYGYTAINQEEAV